MLKRCLRYYLICLSAFWILPSQAIAKYDQFNDPVHPSVRWHKYFAGGYEHALDVIPSSWSHFIKNAPNADQAQCRPLAEKMDVLVKDYDDAIRIGIPSKAASIYSQIHQVLFKRSVCFQTISKSYMVNSVFWLFNNKSDGMMAALLATALVNTGHIRPLTPSIRNKLSLVSGPGWTDKDIDGDYEFIGTYKCDNNVITADLTKRPVDLGATLVHELDHIMRTQSILLTPTPSFIDDGMGSLIPSSLSDRETVEHLQAQVHRMGWRNFLLLDEALAVSYAGLLEINMQSTVPPPHFAHDLSFFSDSGPLMHATQHEMNSYREKPYLEQVLESLFFTSPLADEKTLKDEEDVLRIVFSAYFPGRGWPNPLSIYRAFQMDDGLMTLSRWIEDSSVWVRRQKRFIGGGEFKLTSQLNKAEVMDKIMTVMTSITQLSPFCQEFMRAAQTDELSSYVGLRLSPLRPSHPEKGVKGELHAIRACLDLKSVL